MARILRAAMTETRNAFAEMPPTADTLDDIRGRLDEVREANVEHHVDLLRKAKQRGAELIGFGELFTSPYFALEMRELWHDLAEDAESGSTVLRMREEARSAGMVVVAPIYELDGSTGKRFNTAVVIDTDGGWLGKYRKLHIPRGSNETGTFSETFYYERGEGLADLLPVFETAVVRLGMTICYDRHFEGLVSRLSQKGAELVLSPAVTFGSKSERMWSQEFPVEAARHRVYLGGSNRIGPEPPWNVPFFGKSYFCGPEGTLSNRSDHPNLVIADLDLGLLGRDDSSGWSLRTDRRSDLGS